MRTGVQDQPGQHGKTLPSLLKLQKLVEHGGRCLESQVLGRLRQENCLRPGDELRLHYCPPAWATEQDSVNNKKIIIVCRMDILHFINLYQLIDIWVIYIFWLL